MAVKSCLLTALLLLALAPSAAFAAALPAENVSGDAQAGLNFRFYADASLTGNVSALNALTPVRTGNAANFVLETNLTATVNFGYKFSGYINVPLTGIY